MAAPHCFTLIRPSHDLHDSIYGYWHLQIIAMYSVYFEANALPATILLVHLCKLLDSVRTDPCHEFGPVRSILCFDFKAVIKACGSRLRHLVHGRSLAASAPEPTTLWFL